MKIIVNNIFLTKINKLHNLFLLSLQNKKTKTKTKHYMKKLFDIQDMRNGKPVFCRGGYFFPTKIEEKTDHILVEVVAIEKNVMINQYDKAGRFWGDSTPSALDLCTKVIDDNGFDITDKVLSNSLLVKTVRVQN